ncbi:hypothetical protein JXA47_08620 [Candidatus Sumerlaeota bacterium]|nr:hypothetical protein [Candidatus Sumerlaeota bacterium]
MIRICSLTLILICLWAIALPAQEPLPFTPSDPSPEPAVEAPVLDFQPAASPEAAAIAPGISEVVEESEPLPEPPRVVAADGVAPQPPMGEDEAIAEPFSLSQWVKTNSLVAVCLLVAVVALLLALLLHVIQRRCTTKQVDSLEQSVILLLRDHEKQQNERVENRLREAEKELNRRLDQSMAEVREQVETSERKLRALIADAQTEMGRRLEGAVDSLTARLVDSETRLREQFEHEREIINARFEAQSRSAQDSRNQQRIETVVQGYEDEQVADAAHGVAEPGLADLVRLLDAGIRELRNEIECVHTVGRLLQRGGMAEMDRDLMRRIMTVGVRQFFLNLRFDAAGGTGLPRPTLTREIVEEALHALEAHHRQLEVDPLDLFKSRAPLRLTHGAPGEEEDDLEDAEETDDVEEDEEERAPAHSEE